jgi:DNA gyrase/topoisomerase IV subunit A
MTPNDNGVEVSRYFKAANRVVSALRGVDKDIANQYVMMFISKDGYGKKTSSKEFVKIKTTKNYMQLQDNDELVCVEQLRNDDDRDLIIYTEEGVGVRIPLSDIPDLGIAARGKKIINITDDDKVCGYDIMSKGFKYLFYITSSGKAKITETKLFPRMSVKDKPIQVITLNKNDRLVNIIPVNKTDKVNIYKKNGEMECVSISTMTPTIRLAKPDKLITLNKGDIVVKASKV